MASEVLAYIAIDFKLLAVNRSGKLVRLAGDTLFENPFAFEVCDDRLYVLDN